MQTVVMIVTTGHCDCTRPSRRKKLKIVKIFTYYCPVKTNICIIFKQTCFAHLPLTSLLPTVTHTYTLGLSLQTHRLACSPLLYRVCACTVSSTVSATILVIGYQIFYRAKSMPVNTCLYNKTATPPPGRHTRCCCPSQCFVVDIAQP